MLECSNNSLTIEEITHIMLGITKTYRWFTSV